MPRSQYRADRSTPVAGYDPQRPTSLINSGQLATSLVVVRVRLLPGIVKEKVGIFLRADGLVAPWLGQREEIRKIVFRARVSEVKRSFRDSKILFDEPEDTSKVMADW